MKTGDTDSRVRLSRRTCLGVVGAASVTPLLTSRASAEEYETVVDIAEAGADNSGGEPIDAVFDEHANDNTLIEFPPGRYRANHLGLYGLSHFGMVGNDATLFPGNNYDKDWITGMAGHDVRIENFTIDTTENGVAPQIDVNADDGLVVRDIYKKGRQDEPGVAMGFHTNTNDGTALVENVRAPDGGESVGLYVQSDGPVTVRNCHMAGFEDNGLYASMGPAPVKVEGGTFWNNNVAQVRLGSAGSYVRGATIGVDRKVPSDQEDVNMRGVRISDGPGPVTVDDCEIQMTGGEGSGAVVGAFDGGSFEVQNTEIYVGENYTTVGSDGSRTSFAIFVDNWTDGQSGERSVENVSITGGGTYRSAVLVRRDDNTFRNCCIEQSGTYRNGFTFENSQNNTVADTTIDVTGEEIRLYDSGVSRSNISTEGDCPRPGYGTASGGSSSDVTGEVGLIDIYQSGPDEWHDVGYDHSYDTPVVFAGPLTYNGIEPCHVRVASVDGSAFKIRSEEWMYTDGTHTTERTGYIVVEAGSYYPDVAMEVGRASADDGFSYVSFNRDFDRRPVVLAQPLTYDGWNPIVTRLRDVSTAGMEVRLAEEEGASHDGAHLTEEVGYIAMEPGSGTLYGQPFEVISHGHVKDEWHHIDFDGTYTDPRFMAAIQSYDGPNTANLRYRNLDGSGVEVFVEEERSADDETYHLTEGLGALVIEGY